MMKQTLLVLTVVACLTGSNAATILSNSLGYTGYIDSFVDSTTAWVAFSDDLISSAPSTVGSIAVDFPSGPITHIVIDWNPDGHPPAGIFTAPHFDVHFYFNIDYDTRNGIVCNPDSACLNCPDVFNCGGVNGPPTCPVCIPGLNLDDGGKMYNEPDPNHLATNYTKDTEGVAGMGLHWINPADTAKIEAGTWEDPVHIMGSYDGQVTYLEPMVTKEWFEKKLASYEYDVPQPAAYPYSGMFPQKVRITYDDISRNWTVALADGVDVTVTCGANRFDTNADGTDGCEDGCPSVTSGTCTTCSDVTTCTSVTCDANNFDSDGAATNGCEASCPTVTDGTCTACSDTSTCTAVTCNTDKYNANGMASDGCESNCAAVTGGTCTACTTITTGTNCTAVTCDAEMMDANGNAWDGCEEVILDASAAGLTASTWAFVLICVSMAYRF